MDPKSCGFFLQYGGDIDYDVEASGLMMTETFSKGDHIFQDITFYKTIHESGPWPSQVDGILGLGFPRLNCNPTCTEPAYLQMMNILGVEEKMFSMCMGDTTGWLELGSDGKESNLYVGKPVYVPVTGLVTGGTYYSVGLNGIRVGKEILGASISDSPYHAIVDSGTTLLLLQQSLWRGLVLYLQGRYCRLPGVCANDIKDTIFHPGVCLTKPPVDFPTITLTLVGGLSLELPPTIYFIHYDDPELGRHIYCLGIQGAGDERTVIGDTVLRGFHVIYDLSRHRVGFANPNRTTCGKVELLSGDQDFINRAELGFILGTSKSNRAIALSFGTICGASALLALILITVRASKAVRRVPLNNSVLQRGFGTFN